MVASRLRFKKTESGEIKLQIAFYETLGIRWIDIETVEANAPDWEDDAIINLFEPFALNGTEVNVKFTDSSKPKQLIEELNVLTADAIDCNKKEK